MRLCRPPAFGREVIFNPRSMYKLEDHSRITWEGLPHCLDLIRTELEEVCEAMAKEIESFEKRVFSEQDAKKSDYLNQKLQAQKDRLRLVYYAARFIPRANELITENAVKLEHFREYSWNAYFHQELVCRQLEAEQANHQFFLDLSLNLIDAKKKAA